MVSRHSSHVGFLRLMLKVSFVLFSTQAGVQAWGTDEAVFIRVFTQRSLQQLSATFSQYDKVRFLQETASVSVFVSVSVSVS